METDQVSSHPLIDVDMPSKHVVISALIDSIGGVAGGIATVVAGQPLDTVKVKMQTFPSLYKNSLTCFTQTYKKQGVLRGLYAGSSPALVANIAENSILFLFYGLCQKSMMAVTGQTDLNDLTTTQNAVCGSGAAVFSSFALCPTELIKCKLQAMPEMKDSHGQFNKAIGPLGLTRRIISTQGIQGLFQGLGSTLCREVPGYFFFFGGYEMSRVLLTPKDCSKDDIGALRTVLCGGLGGVAFWVVVFPVDVVKSRIQVTPENIGGGSRLGTLEYISHIYRNEGFRALYRGLGPNLIRTFWATGALFLAYEYTRKGLNLVT